MSRWRNRLEVWRRLTWRERKIFCLLYLVLPAISLSLRLAGLRATTRLLSRWRSKAGTATDATQAGVATSVARLVTVAARYHPYKTVCLAQSLTLWFLLAREGIDSALRIGVTTTDGVFSAHAWIEVDGKVFLDGPDVVNRYCPIL